MENPLDLESVFYGALKHVGPERAAFLDQACGGDASFREEVEQLIKSHERTGEFLEPPADAGNFTAAFGSSRGLSSVFASPFDSANHEGGRSVLESLQSRMVEIPRVDLRGPEEAGDPIARPRSEELPTSAIRYQLFGEIARGGMGAIIRGRDSDLGRDLAIKVLLDAHKTKPEMVQRFVEEAQIGGQLQHPGIAPVFELGQFADQRPYFTMKLVKGKTLAALLMERRDTADDRSRFLGIFERICQTMAYAHSRGVIHRDLKPANIMVGAFGEVQVMDWGLAKVLGQGGVVDERKAHEKQKGISVIETLRNVGGDTPAEYGSNTQAGTVMGTPAYMAPEQALGEIDRLDERADVFGLGALLCEILTGHPPYVAPDSRQVFRLASRGSLDDCYARLEASGADDELLDLVGACLAPEPDERLGNAGLLAQRVTDYLQSVENRLHQAELDRATANTRMIEERKRRRVLTTAASLIVLLLIGGVVGTTVGLVSSWRNAEKLGVALEDVTEQRTLAGEEAERARLAEAKATARSEDLERQIYLMQLLNADKALTENNLRRAGVELDRCAEKHRGWEWDFLDSRARGALNDEISGVEQPCFTSDGKRVIVIGPRDSPDESKAIVWHVATKSRMTELLHDERLISLAVSADDKWLVGGDVNGVLVLWNLETRNRLWEIPAHTDRYDGLAFSPDGALVATANYDKTMRVFNTADGTERFFLEFDARVRKVMFSPDGRWLAVGGEPSVLVDVSTRRIVHRFPPLTQVPTFSPNGRQIATGNPGERSITLWAWDGETPVARATWEGGSSNRFGDLVFHPDGTHLVSAQGTSVMVWSVETRKFVASATTHGITYWLGISPNGNVVGCGQSPSGLQLWQYMGADNQLTIRPDEKANWLLEFSPDSQKIAIGPHRGQQALSAAHRESAGRVIILESGSQEIIRTFQLPCRGFSWMSDSEHIIVTRYDNKTHEMYNAMTGAFVRRFEGNAAEGRPYVDMASRTLTSIGRSSSGDIVLWTWDVESALPGPTAVLGEIWGGGNVRPPTGGYWNATVGPKGRRVVVGAGGDFRMWDLQTKEETPELPNGRRTAQTLSFTDDGDRIYVTTGRDHFQLYDVESNQLIREFVGPRGAVAISPDERKLVSCGDGVVLWDIESGLPLITLATVDDGDFTAVDWSPDGRRVVAARTDGTVHVWTLPGVGA